MWPRIWISLHGMRNALLGWYVSAEAPGSTAQELIENLAQKYKIYHKTPRRRLLGEIQLIQEEMSTVITILVQQRDCIGQYALICDPNNFRTSNPARSQQYELEMILLSSRQVELDTLIERMEQQLQNLTTLEQRARHRIEVREEDNSKTIFVLTVIAIAAEEKQLHLRYQANTIRDRRVLSLSHLGKAILARARPWEFAHLDIKKSVQIHPSP